MIEVENAFARRLVAFVHDLTRYVASGDESAARRALVAPYSGVAYADARAICTAAGQRRTVRETIATDRVPLGHASALATRAFARALETLDIAFRAQGATALEHLTSIALACDFDRMLDANERATFALLRDEALAADAARAAGTSWEPAELLRRIEAIAKACPQRSASHRESEFTPQPLAAREPETPSVVRRKRAHFSASSLGTFAECERRWYYRYVCSAVADPGSSASFYGTAFHWALERFHQEYPSIAGIAPELLQRKLDAYLGTAFERYRGGFPTSVEYELQRRRARRTGKRYLAWFAARAAKSPFTVIGTETTVELDLDGYRFIGYVDRIDRDDRSGNVTIVDYKTGSIAESADEYRESVRDFTDFQLPFYYWARTAAGDRVTKLALVPLKDPSRDVEPIEIEVVPIATPRSYGKATTGTIGLDELERARKRMGEIAAALADGPLDRFPATDDPDACAYCNYANACRSKPLRREDRFGR
jgi:RecB family exonuclease